MRTSLTLLFVVFFFAAPGQSTLNPYAERLNSYFSPPASTKIQLVLNQPVFSPGDTVFFKAYFLSQQHQKIAGKQLLHLDLVDADRVSRLSYMFYAIDGIAQNQLVIPLTFQPGFYLIAVHSNWAKELNDGVFMKAITVVSKNQLVVQSGRNVVVGEGGNIISGVNNHIVVRTQQPGAQVSIVKTDGAVAVQSKTNADGNTTMMFSPAPNETYQIRIGDNAALSLDIKDEGVALILKKEKQSYNLTITAPSIVISKFRELNVIASSRGQAAHSTRVRLTDQGQASVEIPLQVLREGLTNISVLDDKGNVVAFRNFYNAGLPQVGATIMPSKQNFNAREDISIDVQLKDSDGRPVEGEFSISVVNDELFNHQSRNSFADELNISIGGKDFLVDRGKADWESSLDHFLIAEGEALPWKNILSSARRTDIPFVNWIQKSAVVYVGDSLVPAPDNTKVKFFLQRDTWHYETFTLNNGKINLNLSDFYGSDEFFYVAETRKGKQIPNVRVRWDDRSIGLPAAPASKETPIQDPYATFSSKKRVIDRSFKFFGASAGSNTSAATVTTFEDEIMGADITIKLEHYTEFVSMAELIREVVPSLFHRKSGNKNSVRVNLVEPMMANASGGPVYIIDGIATTNVDFFMALDPSELVDIKVVKSPKKLLPFGIMGKNGIVIVQSKKGNLREPLDDPTKIVEGLSRPIPFASIDHAAGDDSNIPDFRSTIYWNGSIKTDASGKATIRFSSSDDVGNLRINVDGISINGTAFSTTSLITIDR
jgi:hypothetical protein